MIRITIEGSQGSGKTLLAFAIARLIETHDDARVSIFDAEHGAPSEVIFKFADTGSVTHAIVVRQNP